MFFHASDLYAGEEKVNMAQKVDLANFTSPSDAVEFDLTIGSKGQLVAKEVRWADSSCAACCQPAAEACFLLGRMHAIMPL